MKIGENGFLAIVVLHYGDAECTLHCIRSLYENAYDSVRIIVVDNGTCNHVILSLSKEFDGLIKVDLRQR